ncbi:4'-phosphopantetheinyl transferase [Methylobacterium sp. 4-46]|uniref:4'-phosphopantetheinyl transferase family protein n=1 Tax=unclassified Methylobacterium TaxID=2615210 RepID=UPI000152C8A1|nr:MULTISPECIES: 4'-phosphopantetheinyl transferase superfamily protein [Methylobacterium]ACA19137.1 4'-phosphopantetheinyl transferase [Methylobacterium sp. 4-46]WFT78348.1 4'-phosphopantetheinyl transferase superfamily protein [Methylobacterium nodulans]
MTTAENGDDRDGTAALAGLAPRLAPGAALAVVARAEAVVAGLSPAQRALPPDEAARIARFLQERDRFEREAAHGLLRHLLAAALDRPPGGIVLIRDASGRPALPGTPDLDFNISHGAGWIAVALARGGRVGIDVEGASRPVDWDGVARSFLHPAELSQYRALPEARRPARALELWTVKEAFVKASGEGIAAAPQTVLLAAADEHWSLRREGLRLRARSRLLPDGARLAWAGEESLRWQVLRGVA